jgi:hypothetical protein
VFWSYCNAHDKVGVSGHLTSFILIFVLLQVYYVSPLL